MKTRHKGKILGIGSCIGIIAPATACADFDYTPGIELLHQWGYKTKISKTLKTNEGYLAGSDKLRASELNKFTRNDDVIVASPTGRVCIAMNLGVKLKAGQKFVAPRGLGSMGYALPCSIAACIASGKRRTICFEGDGSLQHNIQELQLLKNYELPIKLFIYNNSGYSSIYGMQKNHFNGNLAGCTPDSGIQMPDIQKIANAYGIPYKLIKDSNELSSGVKDALKDDNMLICEIMGDISYEELPRTQTRVGKDGKITSSSLEDLYPFIND